MGTFNFDSFVDLTQLFGLKKGQVVPRVPKAQVILYAAAHLKASFSTSKFVAVHAYLPTVRSNFCALALKKTRLQETTVLTPSSAPVVAEVEAASAEAPKKRSVLKLKTKVELPLVPAISRNSTAKDLAAAFKAEKTLLEKKLSVGEAVPERRRHPLAGKSWSELLAEVEMSEKSKRNFDLAAAFKAEMRAFQAEQEKLGDALQPVSLKSAFEPKMTSPQPQKVLSFPSSHATVKARKLAA